MSKTKNETPAIKIEAGKPIEIKAKSREDAARQIADLYVQAADEGMTVKSGGFIEHREGKFSAVITFDKH